MRKLSRLIKSEAGTFKGFLLNKGIREELGQWSADDPWAAMKSMLVSLGEYGYPWETVESTGTTMEIWIPETSKAYRMELI